MDDRAYEKRLNRRSVAFGVVLLAFGLFMIAFAVVDPIDLPSQGWLSWFNDKLGAVVELGFGVVFVFEGGRRVWRGRAPTNSLLDREWLLDMIVRRR